MAVEYATNLLERKKKGERILERQVIAEIEQRKLNEEETVKVLIKAGLIPEAKDQESEEEKLNRYYY